MNQADDPAAGFLPSLPQRRLPIITEGDSNHLCSSCLLEVTSAPAASSSSVLQGSLTWT